MSYRNEMHGMDSNGDRIESEDHTAYDSKGVPNEVIERIKDGLQTGELTKPLTQRIPGLSLMQYAELAGTGLRAYDFNAEDANRPDRILDPSLTHEQLEIEKAVAVILQELGYDLTDQHTKKTPERVAKVLLGFRENVNDAVAAKLLEAVTDDEHDGLVMVGPIRVTSMCAHHMLPVIGNAWVGYIPDGRVVGLSKLARITHYYSRQFTVQERVTRQIVELLERELQPLGAMVVLKAEHGCMRVRGVEEPNSITVTSSVRGVFRHEASARAEFFEAIKISEGR